MKQKFIPLPERKVCSDNELIEKARNFNDLVQKRRTVREFSESKIPIEIIEECLLAAGSAPSGANKQPWKFVIVKDREVKKRIRELAEEEEREFYGGRAPDEWLKDLEQFGTDEHKPFLETAPYLIAIFEEKYSIDGNIKHKNYYTKESVGIATGILITALHNCGIATLTHTPSPMNFLNKILDRPNNEKPFLLLVVGYPQSGTLVPDIKRKNLDEIAIVK